MRRCIPLVLLLTSCDRAPNYHPSVPGGSGSREAPPPAAPTPGAASEGTALQGGEQGGVPRTTSDGEGLPHVAASVPGVPAAGPSIPEVQQPPRDLGGTGPDGSVAPIEVLVSHARDRKFDELRRISRRYRELTREINELVPRVLASGSEADRQRYRDLDRQARVEWVPISDYIYQERWSTLDRAAMTMFVRSAQPD